MKRRYRLSTLVLETEFKTENGRATIIDFMSPADGAELVRIVVGETGRVDFRTEYVARFDYGSAVPWISRLFDGAISAVADPERLLLRSSVALYGEDLKTVGDFTVEEGQSVASVLSYGASYHSPPSAIDPFELLERTETFWRAWSDRCGVAAFNALDTSTVVGARLSPQTDGATFIWRAGYGSASLVLGAYSTSMCAVT